MFRLHDNHVHSYYSPDSNQPLIPYIEKAIELGCKYFLVTDHLDFNFCNKGEDWHSDYDKQKAELDELTYIYGDKIELLQGIEIGYKKEYINAIKSIIEHHHFNVVNFSIHDYDGINFYYKEEFEKYGIDKTLNLYFDLYIEALNSGVDFDVICHIDYGFKTAHFADKNLKLSDYNDKIETILKLVIEKNKVLEINTKVQEGISDDTNVRFLLSKYYELGGREISISSDSHELERYLSNFDHYVEIAKSIGFDHLCYFVKRVKHHYSI